MLIGITVYWTEEIPAAAIEPCQSNPLPTSVASFRAFLHLRFHSLTHNRSIQWLDRHGIHLHRASSYIYNRGDNWLFSGAIIAFIDNGFNGCRRKLGLLLFQHMDLVALGTHVHRRSTAKKSTVFNTRDGALWSLASCLIMLHVFNAPAPLTTQTQNQNTKTITINNKNTKSSAKFIYQNNSYQASKPIQSFRYWIQTPKMQIIIHILHIIKNSNRMNKQNNLSPIQSHPIQQHHAKTKINNIKIQPQQPKNSPSHTNQRSQKTTNSKNKPKPPNKKQENHNPKTKSHKSKH